MGYFLRPSKANSNGDDRNEVRKFDRPGRPVFQPHQFDVNLGSPSYKELDRLSPDACAVIFGSKSLADHIDNLLQGWQQEAAQRESNDRPLSG